MARIEGVARRVLDFAEVRPERRQRLELNDVVREAVEFVAGNPSFRSIRLTTDLSPVLPPVLGDRTLLFQLLLNLLLNAREAMPRGGQVTIRTEDGPAGLRLAVADDGPGIAADQLARIFEPFYSTRGTSGLGLAICEGIARAHRGVLRAASTPGHGAIFTLDLPAEPAPVH
jgi:signal transduction histidine kinase